MSALHLKGDVFVKVKKILSFILVAAMMLSIFVLPATAVSENEIVVHYYNENNWESPYIYYYNDGNTPVSWPGTAMNNDGDNWYSYTISGYSSAKVIFSNNGADQYPAQNQEGLTVSGEKWYKSGSFYDQKKYGILYYGISNESCFSINHNITNINQYNIIHSNYISLVQNKEPSVHYLPIITKISIALTSEMSSLSYAFLFSCNENKCQKLIRCNQR